MAEFDWFQRQDTSSPLEAQQPDDALDWAKQAYARLKAQQEAEKSLPLLLQLNQHRACAALDPEPEPEQPVAAAVVPDVPAALNRIRNPWQRFRACAAAGARTTT